VITVVGLSHKSAPIPVREQFVLPAERVPAFLADLIGRPEVGEALMVSTCNRVELVAAARAGAPLEAGGGRVAVPRSAVRWRRRALRESLYQLHAGAAVRHLFGVASLARLAGARGAADSGSGEGCLRGRAQRRHGGRGAPPHARACDSHGQNGAFPNRDRLGQVSVPSVAADLARRIFGDLNGQPVLLLGSGDMAETVARALQSSGARLFVIGRNLEKVKALADGVGGEPRALSELAATLPEVDVVITSTSAPAS
jgi:glutamyl-tRNA reductase